jgi:hypothetical protein
MTTSHLKMAVNTYMLVLDPHFLCALAHAADTCARVAGGTRPVPTIDTRSLIASCYTADRYDNAV